MATPITIIPAVLEEPLDIDDLTTTKLDGTGVLDVLLTTMRTQLDYQFKESRIRGPEYAAAYIQSYTATLQSAIQFLLAKERQGLELMQLQAQLDLTQAQVDQVRAEMQKIPHEIEAIDAGTSYTKKQEENLAAQMAKIPVELEILQKQSEQADKQLELAQAQIDLQQAQLEIAREQLVQTQEQTKLVQQKVVTEKAQTDATVIGEGSYLGSNIKLITAQTDGYKRDAEQKAAQIWANTWNTRRTTDEDTQANTDNKLDDASLGAIMTKLATGIGAVV